jgi:hypothetical protein
LIPSYGNFSTEPVVITRPYFHTLETPTPIDLELHSRLHDILEQWEEEATKSEDPEQIFAMIDQISDAMYPPEDGE